MMTRLQLEQWITPVLGNCVLMMTLAGCGGGGGDNSAESPPPPSSSMVQIAGTVDDGLPMSPIANAECRFVAPDGSIVTSTTANAGGSYTMEVPSALRGFVACNPPDLAGLVLRTFVSTVGQAGGTTLNENVTPSTLAIAELIRRLQGNNSAEDPQAIKTRLLTALANQEPDVVVLTEATTILFNAFFAAQLNTDLLAAMNGLWRDGVLNNVELQGVAASVELALDNAEQRLNVIAREALGDLAGESDGSDGSDGSDSTDGVDGSADDGAEGSPLVAAICRYVDLNGQPVTVNGRALRTKADREGHYFLPVPSGMPGFVQCAPRPGADQDQLVLSTFVRAREENESRISGQDVKPQTTVVSNILQTFRTIDPSTDLQAVEDDRMGALASGDTNISVVANSAVALYICLLKGILDNRNDCGDRMNFNFQNALIDLLENGALDAPALASIRAAVEARVQEIQNAGGVTVQVASTAGDIRGTVVEAATNSPVSGVTVITTLNDVEIGRGMTDASGQFAILNVVTGAEPFGSVIIRVSAGGQDTRSTVTVVALATVETVIPLVLVSPFDIAIENQENLVAVDFGSNSVVRINRDTNALSLVSGVGRGEGPPLLAPTDIVVGRQGDIFVSSAASSPFSSIIHVDPETGTRDVVTGCRSISQPDANGTTRCSGGIKGRGPFTAPRGLTIQENDILMVDTFFVDNECSQYLFNLARLGFPVVPFLPGTPLGALIEVNTAPNSGDRRVVSGFDPEPANPNTPCAFIGLTTPLPILPQKVAVDTDLTPLIASTFFLPRGNPFGDFSSFVLEVNNSGDRPLISGRVALIDPRSNFQSGNVIVLDEITRGNGLPFDVLIDLDALPNGDPVVTEARFNTNIRDYEDCGRITRINRNTGRRTMLSGCNPLTGDILGTGPELFAPSGFAVDENGDFIVTDATRGMIVSVDQFTGDRNLLVGFFKGNGRPFNAPVGVTAANETIFVTDTKAVVRVNSEGDRTIVSDNTTPGPIPVILRGIAAESIDRLVVVDSLSNYPGFIPDFIIIPDTPDVTIRNFLATLASVGLTPGETGGIFRVDVNTGTREVVSGPTRGGGDPFIFPFSIAVEPNGDFVVVDALRDLQNAGSNRNIGAVVRVDPVSGDRELVSGRSRGNGPPFGFPTVLTVDPMSGDLFIADPGLDTVVRVNPANGDRAIVSDDNVGSGSPFIFPISITVDSDGNLLLVDGPTIVRVDLSTGTRMLVSGRNRGSGPVFAGPQALAIQSDGILVVTDLVLDAIFQVNPLNGNRTILSRNGRGTNLLQSFELVTPRQTQ